jgi:hypothetical protein
LFKLYPGGLLYADLESQAVKAVIDKARKKYLIIKIFSMI